MARRPSRLRSRLACEPLEARDVPSSYSGTVFDDQNGNATRDAGEPGLAGWTVFIDNDRDGVLEAGEVSVPTATDGTYSIDTTNIPPYVFSSGATSHYVSVALDPGTGGRWLNTTATFGMSYHDADPDGNAVRDFGARFVPDAAVGFRPEGSEQQVNAGTAGDQGNSSTNGQPVSVAVDTYGNYAVAWRTADPGGTDAILARVFNSDGTPRTGDILVATEPSTSKTYWVQMPKVTLAANGRFAVAWDTYDGNKHTGTVKLRTHSFAANGDLVAGPVSAVASSSTLTNELVGLAGDPAGNLVLVYAQEVKKSWYWNPADLKAQRYTPAGVPTGKVIAVGSPRIVNGKRDVAMDAAGRFVVVWDNYNNAGNSVLAQRYASDGRAVGTPITVATGPGGSSLAMNAAGRWVVAWDGPAGRRVQAFNPDGTRIATPLDVAAGPGQITVDAAGTVTLTWSAAVQPYQGSSATYPAEEVMVRQVTAAGTVRAETLANTTAQGMQALAGVAAVGDGRLVMAWQGYGPGDDRGITAQRLVPVAPLMAAGGPAAGAEVASLTESQMKPIVAEAVRRWNLTGLTAAERRAIKTVKFNLADLDGATLGQAAGTTVTIDRDAAGHGWFVDPTPRSDSEFRRPGDQAEQGKMDLLTAVVHELGHVLGRDHEADGVMAETLAVGTREGIVPATGISPTVKAAPAGRPAWFLSGDRARR